MSRIESALKEVVRTSPAHTFNNNNPVEQAVMLHVDANENLAEVLRHDLSGEELLALLNGLLDIFKDELDEEMKEACELIRSRSGYV